MTIWGHPFAVRIVYPQRSGKRGKTDLVKGMPTRAYAVLYAKKIAARGGSRDLMGANTWRQGPIACVYDLKNWGNAPECYARRPPESKKHPGSYTTTRGARAVRRVSPTFSGVRRRRR